MVYGTHLFHFPKCRGCMHTSRPIISRLTSSLDEVQPLSVLSSEAGSLRCYRSRDIISGPRICWDWLRPDRWEDSLLSDAPSSWTPSLIFPHGYNSVPGINSPFSDKFSFIPFPHVDKVGPRGRAHLSNSCFARFPSRASRFPTSTSSRSALGFQQESWSFVRGSPPSTHRFPSLTWRVSVHVWPWLTDLWEFLPE